VKSSSPPSRYLARAAALSLAAEPQPALADFHGIYDHQLPEVSTNEGPGGDDGRIAESAATAEAADSEEETWYTPQDAVEAGRSVKAARAGADGVLKALGG